MGGGGAMTKIKTITGLVSLLLLTVFWIGCTDDSSDLVSSYNTTATVETYFPLNNGISLYYQVANSSLNDTTILHYSVGSPVSDGSRTVYPWSETNVEYPNLSETGYLYFSGNAIYYYDDDTSTPEKLLEGPFEVGHSWLRYEISIVPDVAGDGTTDEYTNGKDGGLEGGTDGGYDSKNENTGGGAAKSFPVVGSNKCYITAIEDVDFGNGNYFKDCIKVENYSSGKLNSYWYAPRIGLVKYALGISISAEDGGSIVGQFISIDE